MVMEENIKRYHPLGGKTLFILILKRSPIFFLLFLIFIIAFFGLGYVPNLYLDTAINVVMGILLLTLLVLALVMGIGWLEYYRYWIFIDDKDLKLARGLITTEQIGIPYRRIQDVKIKRTLLDQLLGMSEIIITVLDADPNESFKNDPNIILPALDQNIASEIQSIILKRAQVEEISVLGSQKIV